jgi:hypothetical protein
MSKKPYPHEFLERMKAKYADVLEQMDTYGLSKEQQLINNNLDNLINKLNTKVFVVSDDNIVMKQLNEQILIFVNRRNRK